MRKALTAMDRCDRCGAQAYVATQQVTFPELLWCHHHYALHEDALSQYLTYYQKISPPAKDPVTA